MSDIIKKDDNDFLSILHDDKLPDLPKPFEQEIFLFTTHVAGTTHIENIFEIEKKLKTNDKLNFYREPKNEFDPQAIRVEIESGEKIGYIPKVDNIIFSRLMDAGKLLFGRIKKKKENINDWIYIEMNIYLKE